MKRVVVLGRGGAGKSALARRLAEITGLPVTELDTMFWQAGLNPPEPRWWAARQRELTGREAWIIDGDLGPYDSALDARLGAADTVIVLDFSFVRCAWRTIRRGRERRDYWRWVWSYRRRYLPPLMQAISTHAPRADVCLLRGPRSVRAFIAEVEAGAGPGSPTGRETLSAERRTPPSAPGRSGAAAPGLPPRSPECRKLGGRERS